MTTTSLPPVETKRSTGKLVLWLGILLVLAGPLIYMGQFSAKVLTVPWYAPVLATLGILLLFVAVWRKPNIWRISALVLFGLMAAFQWISHSWQQGAGLQRSGPVRGEHAAFCFPACQRLAF